MRKGIVLKLVGLATVAVMLLPGTALASWSARTHLSISASVEGHHARFSGHLMSARPECESNKRVQLVKNGDNIVASQRTTSTGAYSFGHRVNAGSKWFVQFTGTITGTHPDTNVCRASQSNTILF